MTEFAQLNLDITRYTTCVLMITVSRHTSLGYILLPVPNLEDLWLVFKTLVQGLHPMDM